MSTGLYQPILIFFLIFSFYSIILNLAILSDFKSLTNLFFLIFLFKIFYIINNYKILLKKVNFKFFSESKIIILFFLLFYVVAILPMSDADSIVVFQNIPATIFYEGFEKFNISKDIEFTVFSTETLLILSALKSDNFAQLNLISLIY